MPGSCCSPPGIPACCIWACCICCCCIWACCICACCICIICSCTCGGSPAKPLALSGGWSPSCGRFCSPPGWPRGGIGRPPPIPKLGIAPEGIPGIGIDIGGCMPSICGCGSDACGSGACGPGGGVPVAAAAITAICAAGGLLAWGGGVGTGSSGVIGAGTPNGRACSAAAYSGSWEYSGAGMPEGMAGEGA
eukprot:scaffold93102_cov48-Phaeocystis_antarctica.AAC.1